MKKTIIGIVLATFAVFFWGFIYWGLSPLPYSVLKKTSQGDEAAGQALLQHFPENGAYYLPNLSNDPQTLSRLHEQGPVAFIFMTAREGKPVEEASTMIKGLLLYLAMTTLLAWILKMTSAALPRYVDRVKLATIIGVMAAVTIHIGDTIWWSSPLAWKMHATVYDILTWTIAGAVLAKFIKPENA